MTVFFARKTKVITLVSVIAGYSAYCMYNALGIDIHIPDKKTYTYQLDKTYYAQAPKGELFGGNQNKPFVAPTKIQLRITGLLPDLTGDSGAAFIKIGNEKEKLYSIGDWLSDSAVLEHVTSSTISVINSGYKQTYHLQVKESKGYEISRQDAMPLVTSPPIQAPEIDTDIKANRAFKSANEAQTIDINRFSLIRTFAPKISEYARATPKDVMKDLAVKSDNGDYIIGKNSPLFALGLIENDQVLSINDSDVRSFLSSRPSIKEIMDKPMRLSIIRNQKRQNLILKLN